MFVGGPCDIWSAGMTLFAIITQHYPFNQTTFHRIIQNDIIVHETDFLNCNLVSSQLCTFFNRIFRFDPANRPNAQTCVDLFTTLFL